MIKITVSKIKNCMHPMCHIYATLVDKRLNRSHFSFKWTIEQPRTALYQSFNFKFNLELPDNVLGIPICLSNTRENSAVILFPFSLLTEVKLLIFLELSVTRNLDSPRIMQSWTFNCYYIFRCDFGGLSY